MGGARLAACALSGREAVLRDRSHLSTAAKHSMHVFERPRHGHRRPALFTRHW